MWKTEKTRLEKKCAAGLMAVLVTVGAVGSPSSIAPANVVDAAETEAIPLGIRWMQGVGLLNGDENGDLLLSEHVTRAEASALIMRAVGLDHVRLEKPESAVFADVKADYWASGYISAAVKQDILDGYPDGTFRPESTVLYEEFLKMLVTALGYQPEEPGTSFPENYILTAQKLGIIQKTAMNIEIGKELNRLYTAEMVRSALDVPLQKTGVSLRTTYLAAAEKQNGYYGSSSGGGRDILAPGFVDYAAEGDASAAKGGSGGSTAVISAPAGGSILSITAESPSLVDSYSNRKTETDPSFVPRPVPEDQQFVPEPGQLTAGRWDDHENWADWLLLMSDSEYHALQSQWGISTERYELQVQTETGEPVWDAAVILRNSAGESLWQSRTDRGGRAYVFADQEGDNQQENSFTVIVETADGQQTEQEVQLAEDTPTMLQISDAQTPEGLDLMFVMDTTGSMGDELQYIKEELKDVVQRIEVPVRLSCNFYRDHDDVYTIRPFPFETDLDTVLKQISSQRAAGGGDYEEAVDLALIDGVEEHQWSPSAKARILFLVLDAPPHLNNEVIANMKAVTAAAAQKGIRIVPVASSGVDKNTEFLMRTLAIATNGTYLFLTDDSGIGNSHLDPSAGEYDVEYLNDLMLSVIQEYIGQES